MKTAFFGTPALSIPYLEKLAQISEIQVVVTVPDQPAGRGYSQKSPAVKEAAQRLGVAVWQPQTLKDAAFTQAFQALGVDVVIVVAYGKLIPKALLALPRHGFLNVHFSLLPKYRGAAPMQWALINGEEETGVTLFWLDEGMDTGPVFLKETIRIAPDMMLETLQAKLVPLGVRMVGEALQRLELGKKSAAPQCGEASKAPLLKKEDGQIDWNQSARAIVHVWRGLAAWPGVFTFVKGQRVKVLKMKLKEGPKGTSGQVIAVEEGVGPVVKCGQDALLLEEVQPEGKKAMSGWAFWNGARLRQGDKLGL